MMVSSTYLLIILSLNLATYCHGWQTSLSSASSTVRATRTSASSTVRASHRSTSLHMIFGTKEKEETVTEAKKELSAEETTEKYGLEAGLFQSMKNDGGATASSLLKKYGIAYLATSIPLAIVSFAICYVLVDIGIDVEALLHKVPGLGNVDLSSGAAEKAGTAAIAYAAHKAASPLRFPPTVLLTPYVAKLLGKEPTEEEEQ